MTPTQATAFLKALGCKPQYDGGAWVKSDCPLAPFTHANRKDSNPSFGVSVMPGKASAFNCFTCHSGSTEELVQSLELYTSQNPNHNHRYNFKLARELLTQEVVETIELADYSEFPTNPDQAFQEWPSYFINNFSSAAYNKEAMAYLTGRGVTMAQVTKHDLRFDPERQMIVHPYKNVYGLLAGARGRSIHTEAKGFKKHFDYTWNQVNNAALVWYNEEALNAGEPVVIVEGQFDLYRVERVYPHVMANLTAKPSPQKMKKLQQCEGVILLADNDPTADVAITKYIEYFDRYKLPYAVAQPPKEAHSDGKLIKHDPDSMGEDWIRDQLKSLVNV
jgi:hypothetical protein